MADLSPSGVGLIFFCAVACLCAAYYYGAEKDRFEFLLNRLGLKEEAEANKQSRSAKLAEDLKNCGNPVKLDTLLRNSYLVVAVSLVFGFVLDVPLVGILLAVIGYKIPEIYLARMRSILDEKFEKQLPGCIDTLYAVLEAGQTPTQGFEVLSQKAPFPSNIEFGRLYSDIKTGADMQNALMKFYERHPSNDIKLFMTGTLVANEVGPAVLVSALKTISQTIRNRDSQKKNVKSTIMQGTVTVYVMGGAPIVALVILLTFMRDYSAPLTNTTLGNVIIGASLVLNAIGYFVAKKMTNTKSIVKY